MGNTQLGIEFELVNMLKILKKFKSVRCFCCYSASTKTNFSFCSCSELLQRKFGKKIVAWKFSAPKTVIGVKRVANERYLPYLQLFGKVFFVNFMYCRCKSGPKLG